LRLFVSPGPCSGSHDRATWIVPAQKTEIVLASLRGPKSMAELCREHDIADSLLRKWREQFLAAGAERLQGRQERTEADELRRQIGRLERALGRKTLEVEVAGELLRGWE